MTPEKLLPHSEEFGSPDEYISALLQFASTSRLLHTLCGGVHILDFFTSSPSIFETLLPPEWQEFLVRCGSTELMDLFARDDLDGDLTRSGHKPPESLVEYIKTIRKLSLVRSFTPKKQKLPVIPRNVAVGMNPKKVHEVTNFADYIDRLVDGISREDARPTHLVDFGSGQNYLGRALSCPPYNYQVVAVEGREINITGAKTLDIRAKVVKKPKIIRNKKLYTQLKDSQTPEENLSEKARRRMAKQPELPPAAEHGDLRTPKEVAAEAVHKYEEGMGYTQYVQGKLDSGNLSHVIPKIDGLDLLGGDPQKDAEREEKRRQQRLMAVSIHSCGNLSHFGIRSLVLNPSIRAVAIVGCCYNHLTERLGPPTANSPEWRPSPESLNARIARESSRCDPEGFPMSRRLEEHSGGIRLNVTARMLACQSFANWTDEESEGFFKKHYLRASLQKIFLDRGVVTKIPRSPGITTSDGTEDSFDMSTNPVILGSLPKQACNSLKEYVRAAVHKLTTNPACKEYATVVKNKMAGVTDEELERYEESLEPRRKEISAMWSLIAFSASVVESLIVVDRWLFLREHADIVKHCWVEPVFDYKLSPRNLVVVGIKR
ncbi:uncharacterized protein DNG_03727 [Cephalotrichum gorgonifer]|uniref:Methyltransferase domain-containing protein n=1 Tax=Cephalotrichum gorgonifer TaxID=2041049 RepID=A0AAE8MUQ0_9PEZI|nr:uncharacterized protein DNG_03727 [Cephalotrichum gorgonifer]